jgi:hypothetical protein
LLRNERAVLHTGRKKPGVTGTPGSGAKVRAEEWPSGGSQPPGSDLFGSALVSVSVAVDTVSFRWVAPGQRRFSGITVGSA